ncbi:MAG: hypothetical protein WBB85_14860, partial [Albidovulum sp.]|uniref:hypothetical protein n=1 Tax=Albidovulum sp. TaxID=1872424 RepID=UPI003CA1D1DD
FIFASGQKWVANSFPARPHLYLAIEAVLRQTFGTILTYDYNPSHRDHIHFDNGDKVGFRPHSKSRVLFLQNAAHHLFDVMVSVDGVYGPETQLAERAVRKELGLGGFSNLANWITFLDASADIAMDRAVENEAWEMSA